MICPLYANVIDAAMRFEDCDVMEERRHSEKVNITGLGWKSSGTEGAYQVVLLYLCLLLDRKRGCVEWEKLTGYRWCDFMVPRLSFPSHMAQTAYYLL